MAAYARHHLLPFGNYMLYYFRRLVPAGSIRSPTPTPIWKLHVTFTLADPSLERMGSDKKHKRIGSRETTRDCDFGFSLGAYVIVVVVDSFVVVVVNKRMTLAHRRGNLS
jgi:hypothetical protein